MDAVALIVAVALPGKLAAVIVAPAAAVCAGWFAIRLVRNGMQLRATMLEMQANLSAAGQVVGDLVSQVEERSASIRTTSERLQEAGRQAAGSTRRLGVLGGVVREDRERLADSLLEAILGDGTGREPAADEPEAEPDAALEADPEPDPAAEPESERAPEPEPEPESEPEPEAASEPEPAPEPEAEPAAAADTVPGPEPDAEPEPAPARAPEPAPASDVPAIAPVGSLKPITVLRLTTIDDAGEHRR